jgi:DNA processing protein
MVAAKVGGVADPALPPDFPTLTVLVTISLLRGDFDTTAVRLAKTVIAEEPPARWLELVASCVWPEPAERRRRVGQATAAAHRAVRQASAAGHRALTCLDTAYPDLLRAVPDPPLVLWTEGDQSLLARPAVALVGSRDALPSSLIVARTLARELASCGLVVVSGMALGIDAAAHEGALDAGGPTIAVVGSGLNRVYPAAHRDLAARIRAGGAIVSEFPADSPPLASHFPLRNRIISGLSLATVVVEAGRFSGSLITAKAALEQGRDVLAVPGGVLSGRHRGCHGLIKDGARLVESVEDVLAEMGWNPQGAIGAGESPNRLQLSDLEANMAKGEPYSVDTLAERTGRSASDLLTELCVLELSGRVMRTTGGQFVRTAGPEGGEEQAS